MSPPDHLPPPASGVIRILVVDDDTNLREVVSSYLTRRGYTVETAVDGADGLKKIRETSGNVASAFNLVITDMNMPNLNGIGLVRALRQDGARLRIIACSSAFTQTSLEELNALSVDATLPKGSLADRLVDVVEKVIRKTI